MLTNETQRQIYEDTKKELREAAHYFGTMAKEIRDTGIVRPEMVADMANALAFLHITVAYPLRDNVD